MKRARCSGGHPLSVKVDGLTQARLLYLETFYRDVLKVDVSNGALVRYALAGLVDEATKLIKRSRKDPEDSRLNWHAMSICWAARDNPSPFHGGLPAITDGEPFSTWAEMQAPRKHVTPAALPSLTFESKDVTREE